MHTIKTLGLLGLLLPATHSLSAPLAYDENIDGDIGNIVTYIGTLDAGVNTITGSSYAISGPSSDTDWPRVTVPNGMEITDIVLDLTLITDASNNMTFGFNVAEYGVSPILADHFFHLNSTGLSEDANTSRTIYTAATTELLGNTFKLTYPLTGNKSYEFAINSFSGTSWDLTLEYQWQITVAPVFTNTPPTVTIISPSDGDSFVSNGPAITFTATATDIDDGGDISTNVLWASDLDGSFVSPAALSLGTHIITASIEDSHGATATDSITIHVTEPSPPPAKGQASYLLLMLLGGLLLFFRRK